MMKKAANHNQFDFDIGHITKSPCRDCELRSHLPGCAENCRKLKRLQSLFVGSVSCSSGDHPAEAYSISIPNN